MGLPILFPNVPNLPGVPQLARSLLQPASPAPTLGTGAPQQELWQSAASEPTWGIFDSAGQSVIDADNYMSMDNRNEWRVANYPIQDGGFAAYDKVKVPFELSVRLTKGQTKTLRKQFLKTLDDIAASLDLYTILTPERSYIDCNITRYEVTRRGPAGAYFLGEVDVYFQEIRESVTQYSSTTAATANAQSPSAVPAINGGLVQPQPTSPAAASAAAQAVTQSPQ